MTHWYSILNGSFLPDASGTVSVEPLALNVGSNDLYHCMVIGLNSLTTRAGFGGQFPVPANYVGGAVLEILWAALVTAGNAVFDYDYTAVSGDGTETIDPVAHQESVTVTDGVAATARRLLRTTVNLTSANMQAGDTVFYNFSRDAADAADTLNADVVYIVDVLLRYTD